MNFPLPPWTRRDNFSTPPHQRVIEGLNTLALLTGVEDIEVTRGPGGHTVGNRRPFIVTELAFGKVTDVGPRGEVDYTDGRYYIRRQRVYASSSPGPMQLLDDQAPAGDFIGDDNEAGIAPIIVTASDLLVPNAHVYSVGTPVLLLGVAAINDTEDGLTHGYVIIPLGESKGEWQYQNHTMVSQNEGGWDFVRLHPPVT